MHRWWRGHALRARPRRAGRPATYRLGRPIASFSRLIGRFWPRIYGYHGDSVNLKSPG
jgi:hypothetical protein